MGSLAEAITSWSRIVGRVRYESTGRRGSSRGAPLQQRLVEAPGEDVRGRHLDDDRVRRRDRRLFAVLRILPVEAVARLLKRGPRSISFAVPWTMTPRICAQSSE